MNVGGCGAIDQQAEQFGPAIVPARIHQLLALIDQREVEIGYDHAFARTDRIADKCSIRRDDGGEASAANWADTATGILHDLRLLIGIEPSRCAHDEARRLQCVLANVDFCLPGKQVAENGAGVHGGVNLLAIGHHGVARQRVVMLPASELAHAADFCVYRAQA